MRLVRVLKLSLKNRWDVLFGIITALLVGLLWGANLSVVYPFMEVTFSGKSLQDVLDDYILESRETLKQLESVREEDGENRDGLLNKLRAEQRALGWYEYSRPWVQKYVPHTPFYTVLMVVVVLLILTVLKSVVLLANSVIVARMTGRAIYELRREFYDSSLRMDVCVFGREGNADRMSRFTGDISAISGGLSVLLGKVVREPLKMIACLGMAAWISWQLLLITLLVVPPVGWVIMRLARAIKQANRRAMEDMARLYETLQESFQGIKIVKCFTMEPIMRRRFLSRSRQYYMRSLQVAFYDVLARCMVEFFGIFIVSVALLVGAWLVLGGHTQLFGISLVSRALSVEWLVMFYVALLGAADPARKLSEIFSSIQSASAACERVYEMMDREPEVKNIANPDPFPSGRELVFRDVSFSYSADRPVLHGVNFRIPYGKTVALVGGNGCGKTTLMNLIPRLADPSAGDVLLGDVSLRRLRIRELRREIGLVSQDAILFDDTVMNNIRYACPKASDEEVIQAASKACAHEFIMDLPCRYETQIGPGGGQLSGGQRQRLALARAILRDPKFLLLDEATSQIDLETEQVLQNVLASFRKNRTTIIITHRLSMLTLADEIYVMEAGRFLDHGTHDELMARCAFYQKLHENSMREFNDLD